MRLASALTLMIVVSIALSATVVHLSWWRAASTATDELLNTLEMQITQMVRKAWWEQVVEIQDLSQLLGDSLENIASERARRAVLSSLLRSAPQNVWLISGTSDGNVAAAGPIDKFHSALVEADAKGRSSFLVAPGPDAEFRPSQRQRFGALKVLSEFNWEQFRTANDAPSWKILSSTPAQSKPGLAYVRKVNGAFTAVAIDYETFAGILGAIPVAGGGRSFIVGADGQRVLAATKSKADFAKGVDAAARQAGERLARRKTKNETEYFRVSIDGLNYAVSASPLWFRGWQLVVIVPDGDFLYSVNQTFKYVPLLIAALTLLAVIATTILSFIIFKKPVEAIISNLQMAEGFQLHRVAHRRSHLVELEQISGAIARMSSGLASFSKFIPVDVVQSLLSQGIQPSPGGSQKTITVLFSDIGGFTTMTEQLGEAVLPLLNDYLELASTEIGRESGTIDKFIGDSVMAFWGAPLPDENQVVRACRAALAIVSKASDLMDHTALKTQTRVRIGLEAGAAIVGYIGSSTRLNYTAIGDVVNIASRIENLNKYYGTSFLIGEQARFIAGNAIHAREIDRTVLPGRSSPITIYEPIGMSESDDMPPWVKLYETGLAHYRAGCFSQAIASFDALLRLRPFDGPSKVLREKCVELAADPPGPKWQAVTVLSSKQ
ncbi:hypothetical protein N185_15595 [Sinorhizobium sp. GW3]|nr:hypothetical protein N185_15595 [Sinorhizobium sp. GW3]